MLQLKELLGSRRRRWALPFAVLALGSAYVALSGAPVTGIGVAWCVAAAVAAGLGGLVLVGYLPAAGERATLGCSPCAAVAGLAVLGSLVAVGTYGVSPLGPALAVALGLFGLVQRQGQAPTCGGPPAGGDQGPDAGRGRPTAEAHS